MSRADQNKAHINEIVDHLFRTQYAKMVSILTSIFGLHQMDIVEDLVQDTLLEAYQRWGYGHVPDNPEAWLMQVAKNKTLNYLKRENNKRRVYANHPDSDAEDHTVDHYFLDTEIQDSMLRMIFACCHPKISIEDQIAIVLKNLCGFSGKEIAKALLIGEEAVNKRLYRAKKDIVRRNVNFDVPGGSHLTPRITVALTCLYLLFNEGYNSNHPEELIRKDLCLEAMRLCKLMCTKFPEEPEVSALMALMCFHIARFESRLDDQGAIVILSEQDRTKWHQPMIQSGLYYLSESAKGQRLSALHIEASIAAQHCTAPSFEKTKWAYIGSLYETLYRIKPSPIIQLNLAIVASKTNQLDHGIALLESLKTNKRMSQYHLLFATLGEFYAQKELFPQAKVNYLKAKSLTTSNQEKSLLEVKIKSLKKS